MADVKIIISASDITRVKTCFEYRFGSKPSEETDEDWIKRQLISMIHRWISSAEKEKLQSEITYTNVDIS